MISRRVLLSASRFAVALSLFVALVCTLAWAAGPPVKETKTEALPKWIWTSARAQSEEVAYFRKPFSVAQKVSKATLVASCDNALVVFLNGRQVAAGDRWDTPELADVTKQLVVGENLLAVRGKNAGGPAALLVKLEITLADGKQQTIVSDETWLASNADAKGWQKENLETADWKPAHVFGKLGMPPWGNVLAAAGAPAQSTPADAIELPPGFKAELLYSVPKPEEGSWVSMAFDNRGRIIASDQSSALFRITLPAGGKPIAVERLDVKIGQAQGLLYAYDSLYVTVNGNAAQGSGLYRVRDTDGDDRYDEVKLLKKFNGGGEHGPHGIALAPDGRLYVMAGNFTKVPEGIAPHSPHHNWAEDLLLPRQPDGRGFATGVMAPGGWVARTDAEGKEWELFCGGFRNAYDISFNQDGELFTYDADMEWDVGAPWYRPTRVNHCVSAAEFGWRYGSGKWPAYFADSLGGFDIGLGSPTGVAFGTGARFPAKYQRALYVLDWTYGKIYAMHFTPQGSSYVATFETFARAKPLPVIDIAVEPDGALYFTIGGRGTQSGLYRISYTGSEPTAPAGPLADTVAAQARALRHKLESFHGHRDAAALELAWPHLNSEDRTLRWAARVAIEWQDPAIWQAKALAETKPIASIHALLALIRSGAKDLQPQILASLRKLPLEKLTEEGQLAALRAYGLAFIRLGKPESPTCSQIASRLDRLYPSRSDPVNRELCQLLVYLDSPTVVAKSMALLRDAPSQEQQLSFIFTLRNPATGWTPELRKAYFSWFNLALADFQGGASFQPYLDHIKQDAVNALSAAEKVELASILERKQSVSVVRDTKPRKFIHNWQMEDILPLLGQAARGRSFANGRTALEATQCLRCHRFKNEGSGIAHDLTGAGNRFSARDLLESIVLPSKVISDQYASKTIVTTGGLSVTGLAAPQPDGSLLVYQSDGQQVSIPKSKIEEVVTSKLSTMPEGLINILSQDEVLDLIAYVRSAGNPDDSAFKK